ncbi:MAG: hypothetical protein N2260_08465 [Syntrophobacterales bacterium]|nr:hypothetical protein [Syntrophobacterales bacterium]
MVTYMSIEDLKKRDEPFFLAFLENQELVMEPRCSCGEILEENFYCVGCKKSVDISCFVCRSTDVLPIVEKLIRGNPEFKYFKLYLLRGSL